MLVSCGVSLGMEYVDVNDDDDVTMINPGDEVGIIPPVSSG